MRQASERQSERLVVVTDCIDRKKRAELEKDDITWLRFFFGEKCSNPFTYDFTHQQREMIAAIRRAVMFGGDQALAASRGEGKTSIVERLLTKYTLQGLITFSVLFSATGSAAEDSLESIKSDIADNDLLADYYPEVCIPVRALENTPNRAHYQMVSGRRFDNGEVYEKASSKFSWCGHAIVLPNVPGSPSAQSVIATRGLDAAVRGLKKKGKRPQVAIIDDPDTEETARSEDQAKKLEDRIDKGIGGLGGQRKPIARVMLTTLQSRISASYKFTDPAQKPTWNGRRFRYLVKPPDRLDLWDEYIALAQANMQDGDEHARAAHAFFIEHRPAMEAGAEVANENRFDASILPDGSQKELSSLQSYYNHVVRIGAESVATELDNDPPEESGPVESGITSSRIQRQVNGFERKIVPPGCTVITQGIDVRKVALHWVVRAWRPDGLAYHTIDYGVHEVHGTKYGSDDGVDVAVRNAIKARMGEVRDSHGYMTPTGEMIPVHFTLVDAGWRTDAVYSACRELGVGIMPAMGFGKSNGCAKANFSPYQHTTDDRIPGDGWNMTRQASGTWLVAMDADRWKAWEHDRWMTDPGKPGGFFLFGEPSIKGGRLSDDEKNHFAYSKHVVSEVEVEEVVKGALVRRWKAKSDNNHYLDASYMASVAANIKGIKLIRQTQQATQTQPKPKQAPPIEHKDLGTSFLASAR
jgi:hypothetical protein